MCEFCCNVTNLRYQLLVAHLKLNLSHICSFQCRALYSAAAAAVRESEPAGFGPEGGPGTQGGACTGDFMDLSPPPILQIFTHLHTSVTEVQGRHVIYETLHVKEFVQIPPYQTQPKR